MRFGKEENMARLVIVGTWPVLFVWLALASPALAQDFRGSILGTVTDTTGAVLPGVTITVTNTETSVSQTLVTDARGAYQALYLNPGKYAVTAQLSGFKKIVRPSTDVRIGDALRIDIVLEAGGVNETVSVVAESPLLNTSSASAARRSTPSRSPNCRLATARRTCSRGSHRASWTRRTCISRVPWTTATWPASSRMACSAATSSRLTARRTCRTRAASGFSPPSDAIAQFKVQTNAFDAQTGHTAGAVVNLALKSGTNSLRVASGFFNRDDSRSETPLLSQRQALPKPSREYNRFTATGSGPVVKDKTFFMASFERLRDIQPEPAVYTVPTARMRAGDFGEFTTAIFDPATATGTTATRTAFANNMIPAGRINQVAAAYAALYPAAESPRDRQQLRHQRAAPVRLPRGHGPRRSQLRIRDRMFVTTYYNKREEDRYNWAQDAPGAPGGVINGFAVTRGFDYRSNFGLTGGYTRVHSPSTVLDFRVSGALWRVSRSRPDLRSGDAPVLVDRAAVDARLRVLAVHDHRQLQHDERQLDDRLARIPALRLECGLRSTDDDAVDHADGDEDLGRALAADRLRLPGADVDDHERGLSRRPLCLQRRLHARQQLGRAERSGAVVRAVSARAADGRDDGRGDGEHGAASQFEIASPGEFRQSYHGLFLQDDWRATRRLTLNLGVRLEINAGMSETEDRNLAGFDTTSASPIENAARQAYALNPIPQIAPAEFHVRGGVLFADGPVNKTATKVLPRGAFAYLLDQRTVIRGGIGLFSYDYFFENINQAGFSQPTPVTVTEDNGVTFTGATLTNPIPSGQLVQPVGAANGLGSQLGLALGTMYQPDRTTPYYTRWEINVQRDWGAVS